jgi:hypothetical protein
MNKHERHRALQQQHDLSSALASCAKPAAGELVCKPSFHFRLVPAGDSGWSGGKD